MFSRPRPQYVQSLPADVLLATSCLDSGTSKAENKGLQSKTALRPEQLRKLAIMSLPPTGQRKGGEIGFFEQGILTGLGLASVLVLPTLGFTMWFAGSRAWRAFKK